MTVATPEAADSSAVEKWTEDWGSTGLEDIGASDVVLPRLRIEHADGVFKDTLSGATYAKLQVIILGIVKQRIMWPDELDDGDKPMCKSVDFVHGFPNVRKDAAADKQFPWSESNFSEADLKPVEIAPRTDRQFPDGWSSNGYGVLDCASCKFKDWSKDPRNGKNVPPRCSEQHTYILQYSGDDGETWTTALLSLQRTGIKPSKTYISSFVQSKTPMFTVITELSLVQDSRGMVKYCTPKFRRIGDSDRTNWQEYHDSYVQIRSFIRSAPRPQDDEETVTAPAPGANVNTAPAPAAAPAATPAPAAAATVAPEAPVTAAPAAPTPAPVAEPSPPVAEDDDDLPF